MFGVEGLPGLATGLSGLMLVAALEQPMMPPGGLPGAESSSSARSAAPAPAAGDARGTVRAGDEGLPPASVLRAAGLDPAMVEVLLGVSIDGDAVLAGRLFSELRIPGGAASCVRLALYRLDRRRPGQLLPIGSVAIDYESVYRASFGDSGSAQSAALDHERIETALVAEPVGSDAAGADRNRVPDLQRQVRALRHWQTFRLGRRNYASPLADLPAPMPLRLRWDGQRFRATSAGDAALAPGCD